jgi:hypothetical protein
MATSSEERETIASNENGRICLTGSFRDSLSIHTSIVEQQKGKSNASEPYTSSIYRKKKVGSNT